MTITQNGKPILSTGADAVERITPSLVMVQHGGRGVGAGIVWRAHGIIVTNYHVIAGGPDSGAPLRVILADGRVLSARVLIQDPAVDLAVLGVDTHELIPATIADRRTLRVGTLVLAVGNPWGQRNVATLGIISALDRVGTQERGRTVDVIRSDATLAPGNSGGPLVDGWGSVIGINAMIVGGDQGMAIAAHEAEGLVARLTHTLHPETEPEFDFTTALAIL